MTLPTLHSAATTIPQTQVEEALKEGGDEYQSITDARAELVELLEQVEVAHKRLHLTQARIEQNVQKLTELKAEAAEFSRLRAASAAQLPTSHPDGAAVLGAESLARLDSSSLSSQRGRASVVAPNGSIPSRDEPQRAKGLQSSLNLEPGLRNFWYAYVPLPGLNMDEIHPVFTSPWSSSHS
jgi:chlorophyllide a oxygenase